MRNLPDSGTAEDLSSIRRLGGGNSSGTADEQPAEGSQQVGSGLLRLQQRSIMEQDLLSGAVVLCGTLQDDGGRHLSLSTEAVEQIEGHRSARLRRCSRNQRRVVRRALMDDR